MIPLAQCFLDTRLAHRGLHGPGRPENSLAAMRAALDAGYGIELDIQPSADGVPMVFHDYHLRRLTDEEVPVSARTAAELGRTRLKGTDETIPTLEAVLAVADPKLPVLIEIKDQDGEMGPNVGPLEARVAEVVARYPDLPIALMSFNPHTVAEFARLLPHLPRGLVTEAFPAEDWPGLSDDIRARLRTIPDYDRVGASFISHDAGDLDNPRVAELKRQGAAILCWTIRSPEAEAAARRVVDNVTFEGYTPA